MPLCLHVRLIGACAAADGHHGTRVLWELWVPRHQFLCGVQSVRQPGGLEVSGGHSARHGHDCHHGYGAVPCFEERQRECGSFEVPSLQLI
jgi:hypothetical protein